MRDEAVNKDSKDTVAALRAEIADLNAQNADLRAQIGPHAGSGRSVEIVQRPSWNLSGRWHTVIVNGWIAAHFRHFDDADWYAGLVDENQFDPERAPIEFALLPSIHR